MSIDPRPIGENKENIIVTYNAIKGGDNKKERIL